MLDDFPRERQADGCAGAAEFAFDVRVDEHVLRGKMRGPRYVGGVANTERFDERPAERGEPAAVVGVLIAVELHEVDRGVQRDAAGFVERCIHQHCDLCDERRERGDPYRVFIENDVAF